METTHKMKAICRTKDGKNSPFLTDLDIPHATPNHVIIKVMATPINPSDDYFCHGYFGEVDHEPCVCGFEGAGIITEVGDGVPKDAIGKKVASWPTVSGFKDDKYGMWCQYAKVPYDSCIFIDKNDNCEEFCGIFVNPLTLLGFLRIVKEMKLKAFVNTAAMSALGRTLAKVCSAEGLDLIGIVRKEEQKQQLLDLGAKGAVSIEDPDFETQLKELCQTFDAHVAFDAIAGNMTEKLVKCLPKNSTVYTYGQLSGESPKLEKVQEILKTDNKNVTGFIVMTDKIMSDPIERKKALEYIQNDINNHGHLFKMKIAMKYKFAEFDTALKYYKKVASAGKVILLPNA